VGGIRIAIVDDHPLFRAGVARSLSEVGGFEIAAEGSTHDDAIQLVDQHHPDILLLDISIPGGGGLNAAQAILRRHRDQKIVMLTVSEAAGDVTRTLASGARGYVLKGIEADALAKILLDIAAGDSYVSPALSARLLSGQKTAGSTAARPGVEDLSERQRRILRLVSLGWTNKEIASELDLQEKTIKHQLSHIFSVLDVSNRTEAAMVFRNSDEISFDPVSLQGRA
jgi:two-component system nitrate/nitrite response regulator NarL